MSKTIHHAGTNIAHTLSREIETFASDVEKGLTATPKALSSRYFYDAEGDRLFQQIMQLDEYYLTRTEYAIMNRYKDELMHSFGEQDRAFQLFEFGAGDGYKTKVLLRHFAAHNIRFEYRPIDISANVLNQLQKSLKEEVPGVPVAGVQGEYFEALKKVGQDARRQSAVRKIILFLGSNIGNFSLQQAMEFLGGLRENLGNGDKVLIGFDLKKDPDVIRRAYDDAKGVTRDFNMNLLRRINRELDANFRLGQFKHYQSYNPVSGECRSYLISLDDQEIRVEAIGKTFKFRKWEPIHVEVSRKYDLEAIGGLAEACGFRVERNYLDGRQYFADSLWVV